MVLPGYSCDSQCMMSLQKQATLLGSEQFAGITFVPRKTFQWSSQYRKLCKALPQLNQDVVAKSSQSSFFFQQFCELVPHGTYTQELGL